MRRDALRGHGVELTCSMHANLTQTPREAIEKRVPSRFSLEADLKLELSLI